MSTMAEQKVGSVKKLNINTEWIFNQKPIVFSAAAIFLASVHGKCLRHTEDVDVVFTENNSPLST